MDAPDIATMIVGLLSIAFGLFIFALVISLLAVDWRACRRHFKTGLVVALLCFVLAAPSQFMMLKSLDMTEMLRARGLPPGGGGANLIMAAAIAVAVAIMLFGIPWRIGGYSVAMAGWERVRKLPAQEPPPEATEGQPSLVGPLLFGVAAGVVSTFLFWALDVQEGEALRQFREMFKGLETVPPLVLILATIPAVTAVAVGEEIIFRGVLLSSLVTVFKAHRGLSIGAVVFVSALWSVAHIPNTDAPVMKLTQVFVIGIVLGEYARRRGLHAAIAGHVGLNVVAVLGGVFLYWVQAGG